MEKNWRLPFGLYQFSESERKGISDCERCYPCLCFKDVERNQNRSVLTKLLCSLGNYMTEMAVNITIENGSDDCVSE